MSQMFLKLEQNVVCVMFVVFLVSGGECGLCGQYGWVGVGVECFYQGGVVSQYCMLIDGIFVGDFVMVEGWWIDQDQCVCYVG